MIKRTTTSNSSC